jgi:hypothetical protein
MFRFETNEEAKEFCEVINFRALRETLSISCQNAFNKIINKVYELGYGQDRDTFNKKFFTSRYAKAMFKDSQYVYIDVNELTGEANWKPLGKKLFRAVIRGKEDVKGYGETFTESIGDLIRQHPDYFNVFYTNWMGAMDKEPEFTPKEVPF